MTHPGIGERRRGQLLVAVLTLIALAGCGTDDDPAVPAAGAEPGVATTPAGDLPVATPDEETPATAAVDACALVSRKDAEKLAGTPLDDPLEKPAPDRDTCTYTGPVTGPTAQVEVFVGPGAKKFLDIERELGHELTEISGAGDEAYAEDGTVFFSKGGVWVSIRLVRTDDPAKYRTALTALARTAAGRL
ncbi:hypothetical protein GA0070607_5318 [Micromonospora coriariae]|uniref:DUF3558 domain-containing protein n=1 Tax=Micromonospora coriariae TaxID=285665 RepID=A0A1C4XJ19_9ACTN|nr:hypothetical protein [Micromonospora coriariae]SCF08386.1 hypothetical protein GA0070607_5318 [Micromonospora coriariae]